MSSKYLTSGEAQTIDLLMPGNQNTQLGTKLKFALDTIGAIGTAYYLDPANGNDGNDGLSVESAVKTLPVGYAKLTANKNDVLYYVANESGINLSSAFTWAKSYTHFIGVCAPVGVAKRARIFQTSSATGLSPLINITGSGCIWKNIYVFQGVADATSLVAVQVTGERNYFENCHFAGMGDATQVSAGGMSLFLNAASECRFVDCQIGLDTVSRDQNVNELVFDAAAARNVFENCLIYGYISNAGYSQVRVVDDEGIDRFTIFKDCLFLTDSTNRAVQQTSVFSIPAGIVQGKIILQNCSGITDGGLAVWDSNSRATIWNNTAAAAATAAGGAMSNL